MGLPVTPRLNSDIPGTNRSGDLVKKALDPVLKDPFVSGVALTGIEVTGATPFILNHGLGRIPAGVIVTSVTAGSGFIILINSTDLPVNPNTQLCLVPSASGTINVRVF